MKTVQVNRIMEERIQKYLAEAGVASRREAEVAVLEGVVKINGKTATIGQKVGPDDAVEYRGRLIDYRQRKVYYMINKPAGYVTTMRDSHAEKCVADLLGEIPTRVYPVGRLDRGSEGLLILTNDGELALRLTHPRYHVEKTYLVKVKGAVTSYMVNKLTSITSLDGEKIQPVKVLTLSVSDKSSTLKFFLKEGKNRQIRRMCSVAGLEISELKRVAVGEVKIGTLRPGEIRKLTGDEINYLKKQVGLDA